MLGSHFDPIRTHLFVACHEQHALHSQQVCHDEPAPAADVSVPSSVIRSSNEVHTMLIKVGALRVARSPCAGLDQTQAQDHAKLELFAQSQSANQHGHLWVPLMLLLCMLFTASCPPH